MTIYKDNYNLELLPQFRKTETTKLYHGGDFSFKCKIGYDGSVKYTATCPNGELQNRYSEETLLEICSGTSLCSFKWYILKSDN